MRRHGMLTGLVSMLAALGAACAPTEPAEEATAANAPVEATARSSAIPSPTFHHIHINSVDPERSLEWYGTYWPQGTVTTHPYSYRGIYISMTLENPALRDGRTARAADSGTECGSAAVPSAC